MNTYEPQPSESGSSEFSRRSRPGCYAFFVAAIWLLLPLGLLQAQREFVPMFAEFDVQLPSATDYVLRPASLAILTVVSLAVLFAAFGIRNGKIRSIFLHGVCIIGLLVAASIVLVVFLPLMQLVQSLR